MIEKIAHYAGATQLAIAAARRRGTTLEETATELALLLQIPRRRLTREDYRRIGELQCEIVPQLARERLRELAKLEP